MAWRSLAASPSFSTSLPLLYLHSLPRTGIQLTRASLEQRCFLGIVCEQCLSHWSLGKYKSLLSYRFITATKSLFYLCIPGDWVQLALISVSLLKERKKWVPRCWAKPWHLGLWSAIYLQRLECTHQQMWLLAGVSRWIKNTSGDIVWMSLELNPSLVTREKYKREAQKILYLFCILEFSSMCFSCCLWNPCKLIATRVSCSRNSSAAYQHVVWQNTYPLSFVLRLMPPSFMLSCYLLSLYFFFLNMFLLFVLFVSSLHHSEFSNQLLRFCKMSPRNA